MVPGGRDTGMGLLTEAADALHGVASACEEPEDADRFSRLVHRVRTYLASSRPTTTLGMPRIPSADHEFTHEMVIHRSAGNQPSHVRIVLADDVNADTNGDLRADHSPNRQTSRPWL